MSSYRESARVVVTGNVDTSSHSRPHGEEIDPLLRSMPPDTRKSVGSVWESLPPDVRKELRLVASTVQTFLRDEAGAFRQLMQMVGRSVVPGIQVLSDVVVVGPVNVGKSSLYNALIAEQAEPAAVSPVPGSTREVQQATVGPFRLTDTPGTEHWSNVQADELNRAVQVARAASFLLVTFDATRGILTTDRILYERLRALGKPHVVALNKIDLIAPRHRAEVKEAAATALGLTGDQVLLVSATQHVGVQRLLLEIAVAEPRLLGYLGLLMPAMRRKLAWQAVRRATTSAMAIALIPLPIVDMVPLTAVQIGLMLTVARIYGQRIGVARALEILSTFGVGLLGRTLFHELLKLGGMPGWILAASIAGATTMTIGIVAMRWFESGRKPARGEVQRLMRDVQGRLGRMLKAAFKRKPKKSDLAGRLDAELTLIADSVDEENA